VSLGVLQSQKPENLMSRPFRSSITSLASGMAMLVKPSVLPRGSSFRRLNLSMLSGPAKLAGQRAVVIV